MTRLSRTFVRNWLKVYPEVVRTRHMGEGKKCVVEWGGRVTGGVPVASCSQRGETAA